MTIAWAYLNKRAAAIDALKDYSIMAFIIQHHRKATDKAREKMAALPAAVISDTPKPKKPGLGQTRLAASIDEINVLQERYRQALEFMEWFKPAWDKLTEAEQYVLKKFYLEDEELQAESIGDICKHFGIERSSAYNKKNRALNKLVALLYGK